MALTLIVSIAFQPKDSWADAAQALATPAGNVILQLTGSISQTNDGQSAAFDAQMLQALPQVTIETGNPWTDGVHSYQGPLLKDVLSVVGANGTTLEVIALNDYAATVPVEDAQADGPILAHSRDGKPMRIRDKGPLMLVYPFDDNPSLDNEIYYSRSVWQIKHITVQ
ncbi:MAG: hypothetical protein ACPGOY_01830 [Rhodospirillaceae bacterium]